MAAQSNTSIANCHFNSNNGECSVVNETPNTINCHLNIYGRTRMGYTYSGFEQVVLYPGQEAWAYVYAKNPAVDPLVEVKGSANCNAFVD